MKATDLSDHLYEKTNELEVDPDIICVSANNVQYEVASVDTSVMPNVLILKIEEVK
jgi:hypothetical protein